MINELITCFESMRLSIPWDLTLDANTDYTEFYFYYLDTSTIVNYYMWVRAFEIDGLHFLQINDNYYLVEEHAIKALYDFITDSFQ